MTINSLITVVLIVIAIILSEISSVPSYWVNIVEIMALISSLVQIPITIRYWHKLDEK